MSKYYKHPQHKFVYGEELNTPVGRIAFVQLVTPQDPPPPKAGEAPGQPRFEATLILDKDAQTTNPFLEELGTMASEMQDEFNEGRPAKISIETVVKDGDAFDAEKYPFYKNSWILVARNAKQPESYDVNAETIEPGSFIGGQQARFRIQPLVTSHGVSYKLKVAQLLKDDGVRFAGGTKSYKSIMAICSDEPETVEAEAPEAEVVKVATKVVSTVKPVVAKVDPSAVRARAAARVQASKTPVAPTATKGLKLALDKI